MDAVSGLPKRVLLLVGSTYLVAMTFVGLWLWQGWGGAYLTRVVDDVASLAGILFAAGCAGFATVSAHGRVRRGWLAMTMGLLAWAAGEAIWGYYEVWLRYEQAPFPSWADVGYLLSTVGFVASVLLLSPAEQGQSRKRLLLDGVLVAASVFLVSWVLVLDNLFHSGFESSLAFAVSVAYPIGDVVIITVAWARPAATFRASMGLLVGGLVLLAISDSAYTALTATGGYQTGNLIDLGWIAACGVLGLAALRSVGERPVESRTGHVPSRVRLWAPYLPLVLAYGVGLSAAVPQLNSTPLGVVGTLILVMVLGRQFMVLAENRQLLADVSRLAFRDQLTGLANRALFVDRLEQAVARQHRERQPLAVLCLDLDDFKMVNDELGHPAGDELLFRVAGRLSGCLRSTDTVARLGGDEFAILIEGSVDDALAASERVLDSFNAPIVIDGIALTVRPSIGLTLATAETPRTTVDDLLKQADLAMYAAKRDGGGCLRSFVPDLPRPYEFPALDATQEKIGPKLVPAMGVDVLPATAKVLSDAPKEPPDAVVPHPFWPPMFIQIAFGALLTGLVVFVMSIVLRPHPGRIVPFDSWLESALLLTAAGIVAVRAGSVAVERWAWTLIAAGMSATALGTIVYALWADDGQFPSLADPVFLAFYPPVYGGLLLLLGGRLRRVPAAIRLDAVVVGLTAAAVGAALLSGPLDSASGGSLVTVLVGLAYPVGSVILLALTISALAIMGWRAEWRWGFILAGFIMWVLANVAYLLQATSGSYVEGTWIDPCWPAAFVLVAVASWLPSAVGASRPKHRPVPLVLPILCTFIALGITIFAYGERLPVTLAALSLTAVAARYAITFRDVVSLAESHELAMTDDLTGLSNRRALATALTVGPSDESSATTWDGGAARLGLILLDVDQFSEINDSMGRSVGDELLRRIAHRLSLAVRADDLLVRTGGDEFAILMTGGVNLMTARAQAGALIDALRAPFALDHITVQVEVATAISLWPDHCVHPQELLNLAEVAMADAKVAEHGIAVYDTAADVHKHNDAQLIEDLRAALSSTGRAGELTCHYQPKISAVDEKIHSVEALVRWHHPSRGLLLPDQFLPAAETAGLMRPMATRVLDIALAQIGSWRDLGITLTVAVNLSTTNLLDIDLVDTIDQLLQANELPADVLILEITESTLTTDSQRARNTVAALRELGIRLSLDDYGAGWSSLARLQDLSVDELKLDKVFVARLARDPRSIAIVRSTVALAHSLGAELVAEGVEDETTLRALRLYGCTITQGHVHSPPLPAAELHRWLLDRTTVPSQRARSAR